MFGIIFSMLYIRDLKFLVKLSELGAYAIYSYVIFIIYEFFSNIDNIKEYGPTVTVATWEIGDLGGISALAFTIHTTFTPVIKCNKK